jgi:ATP-dependent DNA helicase RecG
MMNRTALDDLLIEKEGEFFQFKEWKTTKGDLHEAAKICCALANCGGGKLVLGVTDKRPRQIVGSSAFPQPERTRADLMEKLRVRVDFNIYQHENKRVLVFDVASRPLGLPVQVESGTWWYHGDSLILMPEDIRRLIYTESSHDFSSEVCGSATINDLDENAIEIFRKTWLSNKGSTRIASLSKEQLLHDCAAITDAGVTYAALILFGKRSSLLKYLPHSEIVFEYRSSESPGPASQREDMCQGFFNSFDRVWELVSLRNDNQHYQDKFQMLPVPTFNELVVRESLLNAVSHRDYQRGGSIFVRQYSRKIVIESPGGLPHGITFENMLDRHTPRNKRIADILQHCGLVERAGQGMNMMYVLSMKEAKPLPDFNGSDTYFIKLTLDGQVFNPKMLALLQKTDDELIESLTTEDYSLLSVFFNREGCKKIPGTHFEHLAELGFVKFTNRGIELVNNGITLLTNDYGVYVVDNETQNEVTDEASNEAVNEVVSEAVSEVVNEAVTKTIDRSNTILSLIRGNSHLTINQMTSHLGISKSTLERELAMLKSQGKIKRIGSDKTGHWDVVD